MDWSELLKEFEELPVFEYPLPMTNEEAIGDPKGYMFDDDTFID